MGAFWAFPSSHISPNPAFEADRALLPRLPGPSPTGPSIAISSALRIADMNLPMAISSTACRTDRRASCDAHRSLGGPLAMTCARPRANHTGQPLGELQRATSSSWIAGS
jgi:hypothetical protein